MMPSLVKSPRLRRTWRVLVPVLVLAHLAAVTIANLPDSSLGRTLHAPVDPYLRYFGQWQEWDMFTTIPLYQDIQASLIAKSHDGTETRYDPMLPGLTPQADNLRILSMFARLVWARKSFVGFTQRFHAAACRAIAERSGSAPKSVRVELHTLMLRAPRVVRQTGTMSDPKVFKSEDVVCAP
jgi:hypothetical protein